MQSVFELKNWELNIGSGWHATKPVPWELGESEGGIGVENYDGYGEYRVSFALPQKLQNTSLAFYTECMDDADEVYLNGQNIGETGKMPPNSGELSDYRSGVWENRFYLLPDRLLELNDANEIRIRVFDYAGLGGFCYLQKPVIGPYDLLYKIYNINRLKNDIPKTAAMAVMFLLCILLMNTLIRDYIPEFKNRKAAIKNILVDLISSFDFFHIIGKYRRTGKSNGERAVSIGVRLLAGSLILFFCCFFLLSEVTYKFIFIQSELIWCKYSTVAYFIALSLLISVLHPDTFGKEIPSIHRKKDVRFFVRLTFYSFSHPVFSLFFMVALLILPPNKSWSLFIVYGLYYTVFIVIVLFLSTGVNLLRFGLRSENERLRMIAKREGFKRLFLFSGFIGTAMVYFLIPDLRNYGLLFITLFVIAFYLLSLEFSIRHGIHLPIEASDTAPLLALLKKKFRLTESEAAIAVNFYKGLDRKTLCRNFNIGRGTLKIHLKSIYAKTIDLGILRGSNEREKLQRLTVFLNKLKHEQEERSR